MAKVYNQYCGIARAFEVLGERWTPLVVRELMFGGRRFSDLVEGLPGVGTSTLADRLKHLEREGIVVRREMPPPMASALYQLSEDGRALASAILPLAMWGARRLPAVEGDMHFQPRWCLVWLQVAFDPQLAVGLTERYELRVGDEVFRAEIDDGALQIKQALEPADADLVLTTDLQTLQAGMTGRLTVPQALAGGTVQWQGSPETFARFMKLFLPDWLQEMRAKI